VSIRQAGSNVAILGAHQSIAGGYHKAVARAVRTTCGTMQIFTASSTQWRARSVTPDEARRFQAALAAAGITCPLAHNSYLINLASPEPDLWRKSVEAMVGELLRAEALGIPWVVTHPGAYTRSTEVEGLRRIVCGLDEVLGQTRGLNVGCLIETTAGQGTTLGWRFEHLAAILGGVGQPERLGVCFDTCHVFAAGYALATPAQYRATLREFEQTVGLARIRAFHLNDSLRPCGSRADRHAHVGRGRMGLAPFRALLRDRRFRSRPMVLETPKGTKGRLDWDAINLRVLRSLARKAGNV
jgi:deoxyribonuclease-4